MVKLCSSCGGKVSLQYVTTENWWAGKLALVENVPAQVCETCGEQYFSVETWRALERLSDRKPERKRLQVPLYDFAESQ